MPKVPKSPVLDRTIDKNFTQIAYLLNGRLSRDNFQGQLIEGITSSSANTSKLFSHELKSTPVAYLPVKGNVYIYDLDADSVDIRSDQSSVNFSIFLISSR